MTRIDMANAATPSLWRRLAAIFYDCWLVAAIWLLGAAADTAIRSGMGLDEHATHLPLQVYLLISPAVFFIGFWLHGGQTVGMRAWRLRLLSLDGTSPTLKQGLVRYGAALISALALGLGYLWILVNRDGLAWHDQLSGTRLVITEKR